MAAQIPRGREIAGDAAHFAAAAHDLLGLSPGWQGLWHFTVGVQVKDERLTVPAHGPRAGT